jgi:hypothetical protein
MVSPNGPGNIINWSYESDIGYSYFGQDIASNGDINGDGFNDLVVSASQWELDQNNGSGKVFLFYGSSTGFANLPEQIITNNDISGEPSNPHFGYSISILGDINADGYDDLAIGDPKYFYGTSETGRVILIYGSENGLILDNHLIIKGEPKSLFGSSVSGAGDINSDGFDEVIIGAMNYSNDQNNEGKVLSVFGRNFWISRNAYMGERE